MRGPLPLTSPRQQPDTTPADPRDVSFSLIFLDVPLGFALSCESDHLLRTSVRPRQIRRVIGRERHEVTLTRYHRVNPRFPNMSGGKCERKLHLNLLTEPYVSI